MLISAITDKGLKRANNEDYLYISEEADMPLFIVADGMGGHKAGDIASKMVVDIIKSEFYSGKSKLVDQDNILSQIEKSIIKANREIYKKSMETEDFIGMGSTVTLAYIYEGHIYLGHVGDSRAYLINNKTISQITEDHSLVNELIKSGEITKEEGENHPQKNLITRAVGTEPGIEVDSYKLSYEVGDILILCSDGLTTMVEDTTILEILNEESDIDQANKKLIDMAKTRGGLDNITLIIIKFIKR